MAGAVSLQLRLGASASQVGTHGNYDQVQVLVDALQSKLNVERGHAILADLAKERKQYLEPAPMAAIADAPDQGVCDTQVEQDEDQEEAANAEAVERVEEDVASSRASEAASVAKMHEEAPEKPVATPARASALVPNLEILKRLHESRKAASEAARPSDETGPAPAALIAPPVPEFAQSPVSSEPVVNSSTHKKAYMRLAPWLAFRLLVPRMKFVWLGSGAELMCCLSKKRIENAGTLATTYPNMHSLAQGSNKDSRQLCNTDFSAG